MIESDPLGRPSLSPNMDMDKVADLPRKLEGGMETASRNKFERILPVEILQQV